MSKEGSSSKSGILERIVPVLLVLSIGLAFMVGVLWQKVSNLEKGGVVAGTQQQQPQAVTVSLDQVKAVWDKQVVKFGDKDKKDSSQSTGRGKSVCSPVVAALPD